jgi:predicted transcriptional regulator
MTDNAAEVFGALRFADEHQLTLAQLAKRSRKSVRAVHAALRDLHHAGLITRERDGSETLWAINHQTTREQQ